MSFMRPEAAKGLRRWREVLLAILMTSFGMHWVLTSFGMFRLMGGLIFLLGCVWIVLALKRARFNKGGGGEGVVLVDEGRISYFGPQAGGSLSIVGLISIRLLHEPGGRKSWYLLAQETTPLTIPVDAEGAETLFDVFDNLPHMDMKMLQAALDTEIEEDILLWHVDMRKLH